MTTKEKIAVMRAFDEGKPVEVQYHKTGSWSILHTAPYWNWEAHNFRIKPESKLRLYTFEEMREAVKKHGGYVVLPSGVVTIVTRFEDAYITLFTHSSNLTYNEFLNGCTWLDDGSPCGITEEE